MATPTLHADTQAGGATDALQAPSRRSSNRHTPSGWRRWPQQAWWPWLTPVSYTHLTLPTSDLV